MRRAVPLPPPEVLQALLSVHLMGARTKAGAIDELAGFIRDVTAVSQAAAIGCELPMESIGNLLARAERAARAIVELATTLPDERTPGKAAS